MAGWPLEGEFETVSAAFEAAASQFGDREAYVEGDDRLSFGAWLDGADRLAVELTGLGVRSGDVVGVCLDPSISFAVATMAALRLGAIATGLSTRLGPRELAAIESLANPALVVHGPAGPPAGLSATIPLLGADRVEAAWRADGPVSRPEYRGTASDPALIIWTSGTTGVPKGAWFDHANLRALAGAAGVLSAPFDRRLSATPFAHAGYLGKLWEQLAFAVTLVLCPSPWSAVEMARIARSEQITVAGGAPVQWSQLLEVLRGDGGEAPQLRVGVVATAPASPPLIEAVEAELGCTLVVRYAMTESPSISGTEPDDPEEVRSHTVGRPQAGMSVRVLDEDGRPCALGQVGDVEVSGSCVMRGYWGAPELTAEALRPEGWLRTRDTGFLDEAGNLALVGRRTEMYIRKGYNVYPLEVENLLLEHPAIAEVAILGRPHQAYGEAGVAFLVLSPGQRPPSPDELTDFVRSRLAPYKAPDEYRVVEALPRTAMLKVDKDALRQCLDDEMPAKRAAEGPQHA